VRDGAAERRLRRRFRIDMDELVVAGHVGEGVDRLPGRLDPGETPISLPTFPDLVDAGDGIALSGPGRSLEGR
jgi:hypothetical protein